MAALRQWQLFSRFTLDVQPTWRWLLEPSRLAVLFGLLHIVDSPEPQLNQRRIASYILCGVFLRQRIVLNSCTSSCLLGPCFGLFIKNFCPYSARQRRYVSIKTASTRGTVISSNIVSNIITRLQQAVAVRGLIYNISDVKTEIKMFFFR